MVGIAAPAALGSPQLKPLSIHDGQPIVYFGKRLPAMSDRRGAAAGRQGLSGGSEEKALQSIRVARDLPLTAAVVESEVLQLKRAQGAVANAVTLPAPAALDPSLFRGRAIPAPVEQSNSAAVNLPMRGAIAPPAHDTSSAHDALPSLSASVARPAPSDNVSSLAGAIELQRAAVPPPVSDKTALLRKTDLSIPVVAIAPSPAEAPRVANPAPQLPVTVVPPSPREAAAVRGGSGGAAFSGLREIQGPGKNSSGASQPGAGGPVGQGGSPSGAVNSGGGGGDHERGALIVSARPGSEIGLPAGGSGTLAMSPTGTTRGVGGSGGGSGTGRGAGPGSGDSGAGPGSADHGLGRGDSIVAIGGTSPGAGLGGAGTSLRAGVSGVAIVGPAAAQINSAEVYLPSFADSNTEPGHPHPPDKVSVPGIVVVAASGSGGGLSSRFAPKGSKVYTVYLKTAASAAVLQFADPATGGRELSPPVLLHADLPSDLKPERVILGFKLDRSGHLIDIRVLDANNAATASKMAAAVSHWVFQPVTRGTVAIAVNAVIGFGVDTN